jgi:hypothetical protein
MNLRGHFDLKLFLLLVFGFIISTIIGTLSHEYGHYLVAIWLGYDAEINYAFTFWREHQGAAAATHEFYIALGGPVMTMLTGSLGLLFLFIFRKKFYEVEKLSFLQWLTVFISQFWLRQPANFLINVLKPFQSGDEFKIAGYMGLPLWSVSLATALMGLSVFTYVVFRFIPLKQRFTFIVSGLIGGVLGYALWMNVAGPALMP